MDIRKNLLTAFVFALLVCINAVTVRGFEADYSDALAKSLLFLEAQRSGYLPPDQRVTWRGNSGLQDGTTQGVDLVGGYYDAGDHVKFGLPMAYTVTMLSWSIIQYEKQIAAAGQMDNALDAIKWATDYFIKAHPEPNVLWGQVGDGDSDHACWQRAEDMTTPRDAYKIDTSNPGSDLAGETAAAMAAASMVFKYAQPQYSQTLLQHSIQLFQFADQYRRKYDSSIANVKKFYQSASGYGDELLWAAMWLYQATSQDSYLQYVVNNAESLGGIGWKVQEFTWDVKYAGVQILATKILLEGKGGQYTSTLEQYQDRAQFYLCSTIQQNNGYNVYQTPGGMIYLREWDNMQHVSNAAFLLAVTSDYYTTAQQKLSCPSEQVDPSQMLAFAKSQADYILGNNPIGMSYIVGYGPKYPIHVHHRGASMVAYKNDPSFIACMKGYSEWYNNLQPNPNVLVGALVGGPDRNDNYEDNRDNYKQSEPTTYNNAPLLGLFAKLLYPQEVQPTPAPNPPPPSPLPPNPPPPEVQTPPVPKNPPSPNPPPPSPPPPNPPPPEVQPPPVPKNPPSQKPPPVPKNPSSPKPPQSGGEDTCSAIQVVRSIRSSWTYDGRIHYHIRGTIYNTSKKDITQLVLSIKKLGGPLWGLSKIEGKEDLYTFPPWKTTLAPRKHFHFVYNQPSRQAQVSVVSCN